MADAIQEARDKLKQKFSANARIGGKGSVRRKAKTAHKAASVDDKRLQSTFKRLGVTNIPGIEEVNIFKDDSTIVHFENPKVQASIQSNTYVVSGNAETKSLQEMLPTVIGQMGQSGLKMLTEQLAKGQLGGLGGFGGAGGAAGGDEEDDMPTLEENFEATASK